VSENRTGYLNLDTTQTYSYYSTHKQLSRIARTSYAAQKVDYAYDDGRLTTATYGNGTYTQYSYYASGALSRIAHKRSTGFLINAQTYEYDKAGNVTKLRLDDDYTLYNGSGDAYIEYVYDNCHRLTRENCVPDGGSSRFAFDYKYEYDAVGNMTRRIQTNPWYTNREERMLYSPRNELTSIKDPFPAQIHP